jgi:hypothetical protein
MSNSYWVDISGILGIQRAMLNAGSSANDANFNALDSAVDRANNSILPTLAYQKEVLDIVERENTRLAARKTAIDNAYTGQARMVGLTDSLTAKNQAYNYLMFIVVVIILLFLGIKMLYGLEIIPLVVLDILNIIIISFGAIYCIYLYIDIKRRYNMDFNQINLIDPTAKSPDQIKKDMDANIKSGNLLSVANSQGSCQPDHTYSKNYKICVPNAPPAQYENNGVLKATANQYPNTARYFANSDGTFEWRNANLLKAADSGGCATSTASADIANGITKYNFDKLACDPFSNMNLAGSSADAAVFTKNEFENYGKY